MTTPDLAAPAAQAGTGGSPAAAAALAPARRRLLLALSAAGLLLLVVLALLAVQLVRDGSGRAAELRDERAAALRAASQSALNLTSIDNAQFDEDVANVLEGATGAFKADFEARSKDLKGVLTENQVVSEGKVIETGLVRLGATSATALVVVDSNVRNTAAPEGRVNTYRMKLELEKVNGRWLTSMLEFVG